MKLKPYSKPNDLKVFDKISKLKKFIKPIKVKNNRAFIEELLRLPKNMLSHLWEGYDLEDHNFISLLCHINCNLPIEFSVSLGNNGANYHIIGKDVNNIDYDLSKEKDLITFLENLEFLPDKIIFEELTLTQTIDKSESSFIYRLIK